jgi:hypothetical protein
MFCTTRRKYQYHCIVSVTVVTMKEHSFLCIHHRIYCDAHIFLSNRSFSWKNNVDIFGAEISQCKGFYVYNCIVRARDFSASALEGCHTLPCSPQMQSKVDKLQLVLSGGDTGPRRDQHGPCPIRNIAWSQFLRQATIRTRQILLGFYPSVQISSQFMSHDWELLVCMESQ